MRSSKNLSDMTKRIVTGQFRCRAAVGRRRHGGPDDAQLRAAGPGGGAGGAPAAGGPGATAVRGGRAGAPLDRRRAGQVLAAPGPAGEGIVLGSGLLVGLV